MCRCNGKDETVSTWVGFEGQAHTEGERHPSTNGRSRSIRWSDYMANPGEPGAVPAVIPMTGTDKDHLTQCLDEASDWTDESRSRTPSNPTSRAIQPRIVASQWVSRRLGVTATDLKTATLKKVSTPRVILARVSVRATGGALIELLADAAAPRSRRVYTAPIRTGDDLQLQAALLNTGDARPHRSGQRQRKTKGEDENKTARTLLKGKIDLYDRMCAPRRAGHRQIHGHLLEHQQKTALGVWHGLNWSEYRLCTQANNSAIHRRCRAGSRLSQASERAERLPGTHPRTR